MGPVISEPAAMFFDMLLELHASLFCTLLGFLCDSAEPCILRRRQVSGACQRNDGLRIQACECGKIFRKPLTDIAAIRFHRNETLSQNAVALLSNFFLECDKRWYWTMRRSDSGFIPGVD
jgi:hypothetical protein